MALVGIRQAAKRLGVSVPTLRRWDRSGRLAATRDPVTGERVYAREAIEALARGALASRAPETDAIVGRNAELRAVTAALRGGAHVVTILGPGGIGKTTLAMRVRDEIAPEARTVAVCDLSNATADRVLSVLEDALASEPRGPADEPRRIALLARRLARGGRVVIVLDNAEHVVQTVRRHVRALRAAAPECAFVVTSRRPIGVRGEQVVELQPLHVPSRSEKAASRLLASDGVVLLVRAAERAGARLDRKESAAALAEIARRVDGIPLALELAGARLATSSPREVLRSLASTLDLARDAGGPARHATLRAAIRWSYDLLDADARALLERLSVFRGGFVAAAAQAVAERPGAARVVASLRAQSLVRDVASPAGPRFDLYDSIRELAAERLAERAGATDDARARHAAYFAQAAADALEAPPTDVVHEALTGEQDNLLAALGSRVLGEPRLLLAIGLDHTGSSSPSIAEREALLTEALAGVRRRDALVARALATRGRLRIERNDYAAGVRDLERARVAAARAKAGAIEEYVAALSAVAALQGAAMPKLRRALGRAEAIARGPSRHGRALTWAHVAVVHHELGDLEEAERAYARALAGALDEGHEVLAARMRARLGRVYCDARRFEDAEDALGAALPCLVGDRFEAWTRSHVALLRWRRGRLDEAREGYERALALFAARGAVAFEALHRLTLACVLAGLGRGVDATAHIERARLDAVALGDRALALDVVVAEAHRALLERRRGERAALPDVGPARRHAKRDKDTRALLERLDDAARSALPTRPCLVVAADGAWLTPAHGRRVELPAGSPLREIVRVLARASGAAVSNEALVAAAWAGERILPRAARHRVHGAMSELRTLGAPIDLAEGGYRFGGEAPVLVEGDQR